MVQCGQSTENALLKYYPDSKVQGANMEPIWGRQDPGRPHVGLQWSLLSGYEHNKLHVVHTPYDDRDLGHHWLKQWLVAWQHQAITWTNVDFSSVKYYSNFPGVNELNRAKARLLSVIPHNYLPCTLNNATNMWNSVISIYIYIHIWVRHINIHI